MSILEPLPSAVREFFPICARRTYVNACSQGALSVRVRSALEAYLRDWDERGAAWEHWVELGEQVRTAFADLVNASSDEIAVTASLSAGANALFSAIDLGGRNTIVVTDQEFPTIAQIAHAQERRGARVVQIAGEAGTIPLEAFEAVLDERVALVAVSHICYRHGARLELEGLIELAHAHGARVLVDAYQSTGAVPIDVRALDVDFLATGSVKYLLGAAGLGFLYVRRELIEQWTPVQTGWFADEDFAEMDISDYSPSKTARRYEAGTPAVPSVYAALAGIDLIAGVGVDRIERHVAELNTRLDAGLDELGASRATPRAAERRGPMTAIRATDDHALVAALAECSIISSCRDGNLRISPHLYNSADDIDAVLEALRANRALFA